MAETVKLLLIWLGAVSVFAFVLFAWDKLMAKLGRRRVPESALLGCAAFGGAAGALAAMLLCRHKIRRRRFQVLVPLLLLLHGALLAYALLRR